MTNSAIVRSSPTLNYGLYTINDASCNGPTGKISVTGLTGTAPYIYEWSNDLTTTFISGLTQGSYGVTITDGSGCSTSKSASMTSKVKVAQEEVRPIINCKAKEQSQIYIGATGSVAPCCWLDVEWLPPVSDSRIDYMDKISDMPNLHNQSLQEIFDSGYFSKISNCWDSTGLRECSKQCGSFDKLQEQFT